VDIPDFKEFKSTLSEEKFVDMFGESMLNIYHIEEFTAENANAFISKIAFDIMVRSAGYSLNLLETYHEWLRTQL